MDVYITERTVDLGGGAAAKVYQVDYWVTDDHGYRSYYTFGVYERMEVAEFVREGIEAGAIIPARK